MDQRSTRSNKSLIDGDGAGAGDLVVRYFAAARAATGVTEERVAGRRRARRPASSTTAVSLAEERVAAVSLAEPGIPAVSCLDELVADLTERHGARLGAVLGVASFLVNGVAWHDRLDPLPPGSTVDVLPPFAGG